MIFKIANNDEKSAIQGFQDTSPISHFVELSFSLSKQNVKICLYVYTPSHISVTKGPEPKSYNYLLLGFMSKLAAILTYNVTVVGQTLSRADISLYFLCNMENPLFRNYLFNFLNVAQTNTPKFGLYAFWSVGCEMDNQNLFLRNKTCLLGILKVNVVQLKSTKVLNAAISFETFDMKNYFLIIIFYIRLILVICSIHLHISHSGCKSS